MTSTRAAVAFTLAIDAGMAVRVARVWDELPPMMASHFAASGAANGWMSRDGFFLFMAAVGGGVSLLFAASGLLLRLIPAHLINLPNRDYWLAPERRQATIVRMSAWMVWFGVGLTAFLAFVTELTLRANLARAPLATGPLVAALGVYAVVLVISLAVLYRRFRVPDGDK